MGTSKDTGAATANGATLDRVGHNKVLRALTEVADKLTEGEGCRALVDRAYEVGYRPEWDGVIDLNTAVNIGGVPVHGLIDTQVALDEEAATALGYLDPETYELGRQVPEDGESQLQTAQLEEPAFSTLSSSGDSRYQWRHNGQQLRAWGTMGTHYDYRTIDMVGARWAPTYGGVDTLGRTYWQPIGTRNRYWSVWRRGYTDHYINYRFDSSVYAHIAQLERG
ncbi:hypothetical protein I2485_06900 [Nesterenkonia sp. E16_7]|uniref:hypothetical protein n=1 Tax=unclassified Nesterenkonia TaxID=2629769 RepID=UPI001A90D981|nr:MULTISPECIES: hypothetical protein [unclassified Nesterenkonia]MBO0596603.1 hypothetical protein [Nesterenkonia sp. E16_10]MBO0598380.1 hypothetical protein [Nesterenkonia sp. E16_7]